MIRIFSILSVLAVIMILVAGGGSYWIAQSDVSQAKLKSTEALAKGLALGVSSQLRILQDSVSKMANTTDVIAAVESNDPQQMAHTAKVLEILLPKVMKIRILPANIADTDESAIPHMGNADLMMVQETLTKSQMPFIQGLGKNRHLAITAVIKENDVSIGVILASLEFSFLQSNLTNYKISEGFLELKQDNAILAKAGSPSAKNDTNNSIKVLQTPWKINYWPTNVSSLANLSLLSGIVLIPALLICLAFFISYRNFSQYLQQDQGSILKAVKDLMSGKSIGSSYPLNLKEMKTFLTTIIQFKRILDNKGDELSSEIDTNTEIDDFFDEPTGFSFFDTGIDVEIENENSNFQTIESTPISLPNTDSTDKDTQAVFAIDSQAPVQKSSSSIIYKTNDIRGIAGKTLTKEIVFDIGRAVGSEAKEKNIKTIIIGRDGRSSSAALAVSLSKGIISTGVNVLDLGLVPSPVVYFVTQHTEGKSGVVVTGSHNPVEYNGLKIIINGETLANDKIQQLKQRIDNENYLTGETGSIEENNMFSNEYIGVISDDIHIVRPMKVVVDCGNGAAGELAPKLLKTIGCEVIELFCEIDGTFPNHHPDPSKAENLNDLITAVQHYNADVGIAIDGDGDRLGIIDSKGKIIWPDRLMMLFAKDVLALKPGSEVIYDVKCSRHLSEQIIKHGGRPLMWKSGHSLIKAKLKETGASLAGELSGHFFFNDRWFGFDDALYSASRLIEILSADTRSSEEVFADFPDSINTPEINIPLAEGENASIIEQLFSVANFNNGKINNLDGLRVDFADGWGLVRASNTMPALVLRFEADDQEALGHIQLQFKEILQQVKPDISLPF
ncbi:MAG: phosphomannomutase/phosphoglucomutase [Methylococcaceae bacterium]|nr:phosphomannomutase/phosphoglucomutase [Methylococcaceae bacterium]